jgi:hypothetical protein
MDTLLYRHIRLDTGETFYIGIGNKKRPYVKYKRNNYWTNIVNKTEYKIEILFDNLYWEEACELEKSLIWLYGRKDKGLGSLSNMTDGGEGSKGTIVKSETLSKKRLSMLNKVRTPEHCLNISKSKTGVNHHFYGKTFSESHRLKIGKSNTGRKRSNDSKLKMSLSKKGVKFSESHIKNLKDSLKLKYETCEFIGSSKKIIDVNNLVIYKSLLDACKKLNLNYSAAGAQIRGQNKNKTGLTYLSTFLNNTQ